MDPHGQREIDPLLYSTYPVTSDSVTQYCQYFPQVYAFSCYKCSLAQGWETIVIYSECLYYFDM